VQAKSTVFIDNERTRVTEWRGVAFGTMFHVAAAALGISALLAASATAFSVLKYLGAAYLIYLGIRKLMERDLDGRQRVWVRESPVRIFWQGVVVNVLNPKTALFFSHSCRSSSMFPGVRSRCR
jgi:threonine/homoserine/homoserine lactone efflux protein